MANSTEHQFRQVTSGRRALVAGYVRSSTRLPALYSMAWADACAALVESGWSNASRSLLAWVLDPAAVDQAARVLSGGIPPTPSQLDRRRVPSPWRGPVDVPPWATVGVQLIDEIVYAHPTLDLDEAEATSARQWPPVTVAAYQSGTDPVCVLVEVGAGGPPTRFVPSQARRLSTALLDAATIAEGAR